MCHQFSVVNKYSCNFLSQICYGCVKPFTKSTCYNWFIMRRSFPTPSCINISENPHRQHIQWSGRLGPARRNSTPQLVLIFNTPPRPHMTNSRESRLSELQVHIHRPQVSYDLVVWQTLSENICEVLEAFNFAPCNPSATDCLLQPQPLDFNVA